MKSEILRLLDDDPFRHIMTLKSLVAYPETAETRLLKDHAGWALLTLLPTSESAYDRNEYPDTDYIVTLDGDDAGKKGELLKTLPPACMIVKSYEPQTVAVLTGSYGARQCKSFISFTDIDAASQVSGGEGVEESTDFDEEVLALFARNGYEAEEVKGYEAQGARWFGVRSGSRLAAACMVFPNYEDIWEVGGLHTRDEWRRQGYGLRVVLAALAYIRSSGLRPRYVVQSSNLPSIALAGKCSLTEVLNVRHLRLELARQHGVGLRSAGL